MVNILSFNKIMKSQYGEKPIPASSQQHNYFSLPICGKQKDWRSNAAPSWTYLEIQEIEFI